MQVKVIMLTGSFTQQLCEMTQNAIDLLHQHKGKHELEVVLVESNLSTFKYKDCTVVHNIREKFNYNQSILLGLKVAGHAYAYIIANNDIEPQDGYLDELIESSYESCSSLDPTLMLHDNAPEVWEGYRTSYQVCGWFLFFKRSVIEKIQPIKLFPMELGFWYQDNWYADQIQKHGIKHALIRDSKVIHLESKTHDFLPSGMTHEQYKNYLLLKNEPTKS
jgi:hypothetical protein